MRTANRKPGVFTNIKPDPLITKEKYDQIKNKLNKLLSDRPAVIEEVARLADLGDFSENAGYQFAKGKLRGMNSAILKLQSQLDNAEVITPPKQIEVVEIGHTVTVEMGGTEKTYTLLGSQETDVRRGVISVHSPLGQCLIGKRKGELVTVNTPAKRVIYKIIKIS